MPNEVWCPQCRKHGRIGHLKTFQINLDEAILLCGNSKCTYPLRDGLPDGKHMFSRDFKKIEESPIPDLSASEVPSSQLELQSRVANHMAKFGQKIQNGVTGTQTGSPTCRMGKTFQSARLTAHSSFVQSSNTINNRKIGRNTIGCNHARSSSVDIDNRRNCRKCLAEASKLDPYSATSCRRQIFSTTEQQKVETPSYPGFQFRKNKGNKLSENSKLSVGLGDAKKLNSTINLGAKLSRKPAELTNLSSGSAEGNPLKTSNNNRAINMNGLSGSLVEERFKSVEMELDYPQYFAQWRNKDALCWLDVILCLLAHNRTVKEEVLSGADGQRCIIYKLLKAHEQAQSILENHRKKRLTPTRSMSAVTNSVTELVNCEKTSCAESGGKESKKMVRRAGSADMVTFKTGAGHGVNMDSCLQDSIILQDGKRSNCLEIKEVREVLDAVREEVWQLLNPRLKCEKGKWDSPVFAFPLLLQHSPTVEQMFQMQYRFRLTCEHCGEMEETVYKKTIPTFPGVLQDFCITEPAHYRKCFKCGHEGNRRTMIYDRLPQSLLMHFTEGLPSMPWEGLDFGFHGNQYKMTAVIQYVNNPGHFIAWLRNPHDNSWFKCDDLAPTVCRYQSFPPKFASDQIHIVMWERTQMRQPVSQPMQSVQQMKASNQRYPGLKLGGCLSSSKENGSVISASEKATSELHCDKQSDVLVAANDFEDSKKVSDKHVGDSFNGIARTRMTFSESDSQKSGANVNEGKVVKQTGPSGRFLPFPRDSVKLGALQDSPCSTRSNSSSDSLHLPEFVQSMPVSAACDLVKPVPLVCQRNNGTSTLNVPLPKAVETNLRTKMEKNACDTAAKRKRKGGAKIIETSSKVNGKCEEDGNSKIGGKVGVIKPSSVFCVPQKSGVVENKGCLEREGVNSNKFDSCNVKTESQTSVMKSSSEQVGGFQKPGDSSSKLGNTKSKLFEKFKLPTSKKPRPSFLSKEAFPTLTQSASVKSASSSLCSSAKSSPVVSPALTGPMPYLSSVKQYLLNKATGLNDSKATKFEGLSLKSAPYLKRNASLPGLTLNSSSMSNCSNDRLTSPVSEYFGRKESMFSPFKNTASETIQRKRRSSSEVSETSVVEKKFKCSVRKSLDINGSGKENGLGKAAEKNPKDNREESVLNKERPYNFRHARPERTTPSGKNFRLIKDLCKKSDSETFWQTPYSRVGYQNGANTPVSEVIQNHAGNAFVSPAKSEKDSDAVLQDLYDALNIPYPAMKDAMSHIMTDVDDILDFVRPSDIDPGSQQGSASLLHHSEPSNGKPAIVD